MYFEKGHISEICCSHELSTPITLSRRKKEWLQFGIGERQIVESRIISGSVNYGTGK
ncbi:MAG TPA: hypothetical protein PL073_08265 [Spirochaetota bacterium]|jgi:hypothetical protein|nr:hypothetical protein [Spirochaetota bacterium]